MPKCTIDGKVVEFQPGENLVEVAKRAGVEIPVFCYHKGLTVVAQCRMCAVEIEKMPKLQTACSTPAAEGMVVKTTSDRTQKNQKAVMEFLLNNHPLDCPICDKSGECDLQDHSFNYGDPYTRYTEERRTYLDLDMGPVIKKNMNRCIHCTRCIRFADEIANIREMVAVQRGNNTEITTVDGKPLETEYAGNYADVCPTGSLTVKDFRFKKRVWYLKKTKTICEGCSRGCNIELHHENGVVYRTLPRENMEVNKFWICDEGRFNYHYVNSETRVSKPAIKNASTFTEVSWTQAVDQARKIAQGENSVILLGADHTLEEAKSVIQFKDSFMPKAQVLHFGTSGISKSSDDKDEDKILRRLSKTSNLHGMEKLGIQGFTSLPTGTQNVVVFRGGRAQLPDLGSAKVVGIGVFERTDLEGYQVILPSLSFAEKSGTIVNAQGMEQRLQAAIKSVGLSKPVSEILMVLMNQKSAEPPRERVNARYGLV